MDICFILWIIIRTVVIYFVAWMIPVLTTGTSFRLVPESFRHALPYLPPAPPSTCLLSDTPGHSRLPSGPGPRIGHFSEGSPGSSWQLETKMWVLGVLVYRSVHVSGPLGGQRRVIHMCLSLLTHEYPLPVIVLHCVCACVSVRTEIRWNKREFTLMLIPHEFPH